MKLTRLRLIGFKSFVEPTDFEIEPGLTGVVGPNGCGKSNLVEAVRWVMGEASYKAMRASEMDDVIFSGNTERPARNHAEVAVFVDNKDRTAPAVFNENEALEVSRRIVREHGSTFRVNGREVRARDVTMLFADASTGSRSPALVHQGRIGEIIQARPDQRRRVLEEAAGISGLHARRHEAELRLKAAEHNLTRVEDVINQLATQVASLKTQARQAVRYRNISGQVRRTEALLFHLRWLAARTEVGAAEHTRDEAVRVVAARVSEQTVATTRQAGVAAGLPALREAEAKAAAALQRLIIARETLEREEARAKERIAELDRRLEQFAADLARERALAADADAALGRLAREETALKAEAQASAERLTGVNGRVANADAALATSEKSFAELTGALADLTAQRHQLQTAKADHEQRAARLKAEFANIEAGLAATGSGEPNIAALDAALAGAQTALGEAEAAARAAEAAHTRTRAEIDATREPLAAAERSVQGLETEAKTIGKLLAVENKNLWPPVGDALVVDKGFEKALGAALGDDLDAPVDQSAPDALGRRPSRSLRSKIAKRRHHAREPRQGAAAACAPACADRRGRSRRRPSARGAAETRPAVRIARGRFLALGRLCGRGACADRRSTAARRARPLAGDRRRARGGARRCCRQEPHRRSSGGRSRRRRRRRSAGAHPLARRANRN